MKKIYLLSIFLLFCFTMAYSASYISFNNVYSATIAAPKITSASSALAGSSFRITSTNTFTNVGTSAKAIYDVTFIYTDVSGVSQSFVGMIESDVNSNSASSALIFKQTTSLGVHTLTTPAVSFYW